MSAEPIPARRGFLHEPYASAAIFQNPYAAMPDRSASVSRCSGRLCVQEDLASVHKELLIEILEIGIVSGGASQASAVAVTRVAEHD